MPQDPKKHQPFVPETMEMTELTLRAVLIGLVLTVVLGAANAYLGLRAGITIAATYPAAVIGMAALRAFKQHALGIFERRIEHPPGRLRITQRLRRDRGEFLF